MFDPKPTAKRPPQTLMQVLREVHTLDRSPVADPTTSRLVTKRERILEEARQEGYSEGMARGRIDGFQAGREEAFRETEEERQAILDRQFQSYLDDMENLGQEMRQAMADWFAQAETQLGAIAILIAERLIRRELSLDPTLVLEIVKETVKEITHASEARIVVNPLDQKFLVGREAEILQAAPTIRSLSVVADPTVHAGCVIQTEGGAVNARIESGLRRLAEEVLER